MKQTKLIMGMPISVEVTNGPGNAFQEVFSYFEYVDGKFSPYKSDSEISKINRGEIKTKDYSEDMKTVLLLAEQTKHESNGYFDIKTPQGIVDPSGLVKGWAILQAAQILRKKGFDDFLIEAGGDVQASRTDQNQTAWSAGIRHPFEHDKIVKVLHIRNEGLATSGTYERGNHIYNPLDQKKLSNNIVSLTVIAKNIYEADRFATAAFAMGKKGIEFIEQLDGFEGYMIEKNGMGTETSGLKKFQISNF